MARVCSVLYAVMVRNADEKERAKIDRQLESAVISAELQNAGRGTRRRRNTGPTSVRPVSPDAPTPVVSERFGRKTPPPGFGTGVMSPDEVGDIQAFMRPDRPG